MKTLFFLLLIALNCGQSTSVLAEDSKPVVEIQSIQIGFDGLYKVGRWVPVTVEVTTKTPRELQLAVISLSPDGNPTEAPSNVFSLTEPGKHQLSSLFQCGLLDCPLKIRVMDAKTKAILQEVSYSPKSTSNRFRAVGLQHGVELWSVIGKTSGFEPIPSELDGELKLNQNQFTTLLPTAADLPATAAGLDSLDSLILASKYALSTAQSKTIRAWVANGGHLVVCVGGNVKEYQGSELAKWIPVTVEGTSRVRELSSLELYASVRSRIRGVATAAKINIRDGEVLATSLDGPLLVRVPYGLGVVTFLGLDLNTSPIVNWEGLKDLCDKLATRVVQSASGSRKKDELGKRISQTGISELETQMFHSQQGFPEVERPSHWWVMGLVLFYLILIGPLDYLLVHRVLKKPHITWITFPSLVILAAAWGVYSALESNGSKLETTQLNLVDYDASIGQFRGRFYLNLYSPEMRRHEVSVSATVPTTQTTPEVFPTHLCWNGLPESTFAGMYRSAEGTIIGPAYQFAEDSQSIVNLPVLKWGTKSLKADWSREQSDLVQSELTGNTLSQLSGTLTHQFSGPLKDWVLAYGNRIYLPVVNPERLDETDIPAGESWNINGPRIESRNIKGYLTRAVTRRIEQKGQHNATVVTVQTDYDPFSKGTYEILKMLTYHEMSGGSVYTGLSNLTAEQLDLSEQLRLGRAVLFARIETPLSQVTLDDQALEQQQQSTYLRVVIPVKKSVNIQNELPSFNDQDKEKAKDETETENQPTDQKDTPSGSDTE